MDKKLKNKWLKALRSGKYKQCKGKLTNNLKSFCCLGVLCDVVSPKGWEKLDSPLLSPPFLFKSKVKETKITHTYESKWNTLPSSIQRKFPKLDCHKLMVLNDKEGYTFDQIADEIEKM